MVPGTLSDWKEKKSQRAEIGAPKSELTSFLKRRERPLSISKGRSESILDVLHVSSPSRHSCPSATHLSFNTVRPT